MCPTCAVLPSPPWRSRMPLREAIEQAGYNVDDFSAKIENPTSNEVFEEEADVVIMGAGTAGLVCAARLLEAGYSVTLVEKRDIPGGSMAMTFTAALLLQAPRCSTTTTSMVSTAHLLWALWKA